MVDAVTTQILSDPQTGKRAVLKFNNISDGSGEADIVKVDVSTLNGADVDPRVNISKLVWSISGAMKVHVNWDGGTPGSGIILSGNGEMILNLNGFTIKNDAVTPTGDIKFTTIGAVANDTYSIILEVRKVSGWV